VTNKLTDIDHVGIATQDLDAAVDLYRRTLGTEPAHRERVQDQGVEEVMFALGSSFIQLLGALDPDTPVGRFLSARGPGLHHIAYRVLDIESSLDDLRAEGFRLIDEHGRPGSRGTTIAFIHPRSLNGVLTELDQAPAG
jgi:methylmalonyl-CoA/ethylmalonyl-CoA epimerase